MNALAELIGHVIVSAAVSAVFPVIMLYEIFSFLPLSVVALKGIHRQPVVRASLSTAQEIVDLVAGDKETPLGIISLGGGKMQRLSL